MFHGAVPEVLVKDAPGAFLEPAWSISLEWQFYLVAPLLTNPIVRYLGRISYGLYLSHTVVIIVIQYALLTWAPGLSQMAHFVVLLASTTAVTIAVWRCCIVALKFRGSRRVVLWLADSLPDRPSGRRTRCLSPGRLGSLLFVLAIPLLDRPR